MIHGHGKVAGRLGSSFAPGFASHETVAGDVFERPGCESVVTRAIEALGRLDLFVSTPAFSRRGDFLDYDPALFEKVVRGTLIGGFHMSQLVARRYE